MKRSFLDTSVLIHFFLGNVTDQDRRASELLRRVAAHEETIVISHTVIFETIYVLSGSYGIPRPDVSAKLGELLDLTRVECLERREIVAALALWVAESPLSFADCYHLVLAESLGITEIYSFDKKMSRYPGVTRVEP